MEKGNGILERMFARRISYAYADRRDRRKLIAVFVIALLLFITHMTQAIQYHNMRSTIATVLSVRTQTVTNYSRNPFTPRTKIKYYATVEYTVNGSTYSKEISVNELKESGQQIRIYYRPDRPDYRPQAKKAVWVALLCCAFQAWVMCLTGIPACLWNWITSKENR
ncbi:MAG: DUF3592 domain-containing protein [Oscillospiraceae bacterium]|nr:DUF3592 domain-containing protein [Oscillospiraceae bacterium]